MCWDVPLDLALQLAHDVTMYFIILLIIITVNMIIINK